MSRRKYIVTSDIAEVSLGNTDININSSQWHVQHPNPEADRFKTRQAGSKTVFKSSATKSVGDAMVAAYIQATGITDPAIIVPLEKHVANGKINGWLNRCIAIYPFPGGSFANKFNLINPLDTNGAFRLTQSGVVSHTVGGVQGNGTTGYFNTHISPLNNLSQNDYHISFYSRSNVNLTQVELGARTGNGGTDIPHDCFLEIRTANVTYYGCNKSVSNTISFADTNSLGYYLATRRGSLDCEVFKNGVSKATNTTDASSTLTARNLYLLALSNSGDIAELFSTKQCGYATAGLSMTSAMQLLMYNDIQQLMTDWGRQV